MQKHSLKPSGLNDRFLGNHLSFSDYIELMRNIIIETRHDIHTNNAEFIIEANSPFAIPPLESIPPKTKIKNGILLIHGLFDSPFFLIDLAKYFHSKDFISYSILLPGHGTVPGDLLAIEYQEWVKAVDYGMKCLAEKVDNIYIAGYSLGGTLALHHALSHQQCKGLILLAPALKPKSYLKYFLAKNHKLFSWVSDQAKWYQVREQVHLAKYNSYPFNASYQACQTILETQLWLKKISLHMPLFIVISADDETISNKAVLHFFDQQPNPHNKLLIYGRLKLHSKDPRILINDSHFRERKILDFSHICLPISPQNPYLGEKALYRDFTHYRKEVKYKYANAIYLGAISRKNLRTHTMQRLSYNPDFDNMVKQIDIFLENIS